MLDFAKEAFLEEKRDFVFVNRFGMLQHQSAPNKAIPRIIRDCNEAVLRKNPSAKVLLPHFSCHSLRHTFTTRMCEAGVNVKVIQNTLGHADISTTLNIYADVSRELKMAEFEGRDKWFDKSMGQKKGDKNAGPETAEGEGSDSQPVREGKRDGFTAHKHFNPGLKPAKTVRQLLKSLGSTGMIGFNE